MSLVVEVDGVALADGALIIAGPNNSLPGGVQGLPLAAWYGEALTGGYVIDDPEGTMDFTGLHTIVAYETAATTRPFISGGWITGRRTRRGPYKSGAGRVHDVDFIDINWNYALMVFRASSAKRPAETDLVRAAFIQASAPMAFTPSFDNGRFNVSTNPVSFDESDLVTKYPIEAFNEFAGIAGKNFYNYWDNDTEQISIHYDLVGVGPTATIAVSNDMADTDATTFYPYLDAELDQGPAYKVTGMLLGYRGAYAYGIRQATIDDLSPSIFSPSEFQRDEVYRTDRIGRLATAEAQIVTMLDDRSVDTDTIKVTIEVPAAQVNDAYPGELLPSKFVHLMGYETSTDIPIIRRNVVPKDGRTDTYLIHFELSGDGRPSGPGGGDPGPFPHEPAECDLAFIQSEYDFDLAGNPQVTLASTPTPGNLLIAYGMCKGSDPGATVTGFTQINRVGYLDANGTDHALLLYRICEAGDDANFELINVGAHASSLCVAEFSGAGSLITFGRVSLGPNTGGPGVPWNIGTVSSPGTSLAIMIGGFGTGDPDPGDTLDFVGPGTKIFDTVDNVPFWAGGYTTIEAGTFTGQMEYTGDVFNHQSTAGIVALFQCASGDQPPAAGTPVEGEIVGLGDGVETEFTTNFPFADGSLRVFVDDTDQTAGLVDQDGAAGTFTMGFAPTPTEQIVVYYLGR